MSVSLAPRVTARRSHDELKALAEQGNVELRSLADDEASPAEVVAWVARHFSPESAAVACSMADAALPHLVAQPIVHAAHVKRVLSTSDMTAQRALARLTEAGVLVETTGRRRSRVWQHPGILAVLDAYAETVRRGHPG